MIVKKIKVKRKYIQAINIRLQTKNLIILKGSKGYVMCGYLNLGVANKFKDVAIKVVGVSSIKDILRARVNSCSVSAKKLGVFINQPIKDVLKLIA